LWRTEKSEEGYCSNTVGPLVKRPPKIFWQIGSDIGRRVCVCFSQAVKIVSLKMDTDGGKKSDLEMVHHRLLIVC
jgi:hypothetical protein